MYPIIMRLFFITVCILCVPMLSVSAQGETAAASSTESSVTATGISYDEAVTISGGVLYYRGDSSQPGALVETAHDTDGDGVNDLWLEYENDEVVRELHDTTGDESVDLEITVNANEQVASMSGESAKALTVKPVPPFSPNFSDISTAAQQDDLVGDLSDITIDEESNSWMFFVFLLIIGAGIYFFWRRQR